MAKKYFILFLLCGCILSIGRECLAQVQRSSSTQPNIVLILSDDMGFSDLGCYGSEISTANLDSLAMNGLRYTQFYNMDHCAPSRAALLTGLYPHQTGLGWMPDRDFHLPGYIGELNNNCITIAEVLKESGYSTSMSGKWHLSRNVHASGPAYNWPLQRGFDKFYGILTGAGNYYDPPTLCRGNTLITPENDPVYHSDHFYFTNAITDNAIRYLKKRPKDKPFFLYVAYTTAHWPMQAPDSAIEQYKGKYSKGWDILRKKRYERELALGVIDSSTILSPPDTKPWNDEKDKPAMERRMETYAAMITIMDHGIGEIVNELKKENIIDNTVIIFLQDNGGNGEDVGYGGPNGETKPVANDTGKLKPLEKDQIQYAVVPPITHSGAISIMGKKVMAGPENTYLAYLKPWGNLSNTPFRKYKNFTYEGGIATPLIVHWPKGIKAEYGALRKQPGHEIDVMPTILQLAGISYPRNYKGHKITPLSGVSLVPTFTNRPLKPRAIYFAHQANRAMRMGKWKIVSGGTLLKGGYGNWKAYESTPWELYNMDEDRSELRDLSGQYPAVVKKMSEMWEAWAHETNVYPMPWKQENPPEKSYYLSTPWKYPDF